MPGAITVAHHQEAIPMTSELRTSIDIDATPERVWEVLTDVPGYPEWTPGLTSATGTFAAGDRVVFGFSPMHVLLRTTVPATVLEATPCRRLRYTLRFARLGMPSLLDTEHTSTIELREGGVQLWLELRVRGLLLALMIHSLSPHETPTFGPMPAALKARIEGMEAPRPD
jgi:uncharacterized protein YndB with AHSA1/START domain